MLKLVNLHCGGRDGVKGSNTCCFSWQHKMACSINTCFWHKDVAAMVLQTTELLYAGTLMMVANGSTSCLPKH